MKKLNLSNPSTRKTLAIVCFIVAIVLLFVAYQTVTTKQYALYRDNLARYQSEAESCRELINSTYGSHYAMLAETWDGMAKDAMQYLSIHRIGAIALVISAIGLVVLSVMLLIRPLQKKTIPIADTDDLPKLPEKTMA